ncbi:hypothetical protein C8R45DRAFT_568414 [Mycena sanguinolenta]|nr:hypothetical protein C8R45DRAFT_568414 [Mycena sanguinolenta]
MQKIPSAPWDLIKLWGNYECMVPLEGIVRWGRPTAKHSFPCSPEFLRILISLVVFQPGELCVLSKVHDRLDLTWTEMRTSICGPSSTVARDERGLPVLADRMAFRDVALQCIRKMVKNHINVGGQVYSWESRDAAFESTGRPEIADDATKEEIYKHTREQVDLARGISYLVRLSPPCPVLYRELWSIPIVPEDARDETGWSNGSWLIHHISKWLESFPDPAMELIAFWNQAQGKLESKPLDIHYVEYAEKEWRDRVERWNETIVCLKLPDELKLPLL